MWNRACGLLQYSAIVLHELQISRLGRRSAHEAQGLGCGVRCFYVRIQVRVPQIDGV
jgi:hypothetical protein